jgi:SWIM zinc finger
MTITISSQDPRSIRAIEIAATSNQWLKCRGHDGSKRYGVSSQSEPGRYYLADTRTCDCPDAQRRGLPCKHVLAVRLHVELVRAQQRREVKAAAEYAF